MKRKIITILTLTLPITIYLFVFALLFRITPDVTIYDEIGDLTVITQEDEYFIYGDIETRFSGGYVLVIDNQVGALVSSDDIIKIDRGYYSYTQDKDGVLRFVDIKELEQQEQQGMKLPLTFVISLIAVLIVSMIIMGKFDVIKKRPYASVLVSLWLITGILYIVNLIVDNILGVFLMAAVSWSIYMIERLFWQGKITQTQNEKTQSDLVNTLNELLGGK